MVMQKVISTLIGLSLFVGASAFADGTPTGIILLPSFSVQKESNQLYGDQSGIPFDLRVGYVNADGIYFGALYANKTISGQYSRSETTLGNSIGYFYSNAAILASYFITSAQTESGPGVGLRRTGGMGFQVDVALAYPLEWGVSLVPMLTYKSLVFDTVESQGVIMSTTSTQTSLHPYLGFQYVF